MGDCFKSTGDIIEETRVISSFREIELNDRINLFITYGTERSLKVNAGENLQEFIKTNLKNGVLKISNDNRCNWVRSFKKEIDVFVTTPILKEITYYGSGEVNFTNQFITDTLLINQWEASGDIKANISADLVELKTHTGVGTISAKGDAKELVAYVGSNGFVNAEEISAEKVLAVNESTGFIKVTAMEFLKVEIRSNGNVQYLGNPAIELFDIGNGKLIKLD